MRFVDASVLVYSLDYERDEPKRTAIAREILTHSDIAMSVQVLLEFYVQATHPRRGQGRSLRNGAQRGIERWTQL